MLDAKKKPTTIAQYIAAAPAKGRPHLRRLYEILKKEAPHATEAIKWGSPFFVEPRYIYSFSACKEHLNFAPDPTGLEAFRKELAAHKTTKYFLQVRYDEPLPEALIRKMAKARVKAVKKKKEGTFW